MAKKIKIAIAGLGTVGSGVVDVLQSKFKQIENKSGVTLELAAVSDRNNIHGLKFFLNALDLCAQKDIDIIVETIGGVDFAFELCKLALSSGKHVVTANKAMIAVKGLELAKIAEKNKVYLLFEAAVGGGIPILKTIKQYLICNDIAEVQGILNGTCNYILSAMQEKEQDFTEVLAEAQKLGFAEKDPSFDIDGIDTAHKIAILSSMCFGTKVDFNSVKIDGIRNIGLSDIRSAKEKGCNIKLIASAKKINGTIVQEVAPCFVNSHNQFYHVNGVLNGITIKGDNIGDLTLIGRGAGKLPTASAIVSDIIDIATDKAINHFGFGVAAV